MEGLPSRSFPLRLAVNFIPDLYVSTLAAASPGGMVALCGGLTTR